MKFNDTYTSKEIRNFKDCKYKCITQSNCLSFEWKDDNNCLIRMKNSYDLLECPKKSTCVIITRM